MINTDHPHTGSHVATQIWSLLLAGLAAGALTGCATPDYPIKQGYTPPPPVKPKYPISKPADNPPVANPPSAQPEPQSESAPSAASDSAAQTEAAPGATTAAPAPAAVESAPLLPISTEPQPVVSAPATAATSSAVPTPSETTPIPVTPAVTQSAPAATTPTASSVVTQPTAPPPAAGPIATQPAPTSPLPSAQASTQTSPQTPAATTAQPAATPPAPPPPAAAPPAAMPVVERPAPPPAVYTPPKPVRRTETRLVADGKVVAARGMYRDYEVREGDHLDAIARDLQTTREELIRANRLRKPFRIHPGEHIKVPVAKAYVVVGGDTLGAVAHRFGVSLNDLADLNDLPAHGRLAAGMYIALPDSYDDHGPSRETVTEEVYERPEARYTAAGPRPAGEDYAPGPYTPSADALAAAQVRREALNRPTPSFNETRPAERSETPLDTARLASLGQGKFIWPVKGTIVSGYGSEGVGRRNDGVDIGAPEGAEVRAAAVGEVVYAGDQVPGFGNLVLIKHAGGWVSAYAHLAQVDVHMRDTVYQGQQIGTVGDTGGASQPELHFELRYAATPDDKAKPLDPLVILPK